MPLCSTCNHFFQTQVFDFSVVDVTVDDYPRHFSILGFLKAVDQKCFICWRAFRHSFSNPAKGSRQVYRESLREQGFRQIGDASLTCPAAVAEYGQGSTPNIFMG